MGLASEERHIVRIMLENVFDENVLSVARILQRRKEVSEVELIRRFGNDSHYVRRALYALHGRGYAGFRRKKDETIGWYTYFWYFKPSEVVHDYYKQNAERLQRLEERLAREKETVYYSCPNGCLRLDFDHAVEYRFRCPDCGTLLDPEEMQHYVRQMRSQIRQLKAALTLPQTSRRVRG